MAEPRQIVAYWRQSLLDSALSHIEVQEGRTDGMRVHGNPAHLVLAEEVLVMARKLARTGYGEEIPALLSLLTITRSHGREANRRLMPVLLTPVLIRADGRIAPHPEGGAPWIQRAVLSAPFHLAPSRDVKWFLDRYPRTADAEEKAFSDLPWDDQWQIVMLGATRLLQSVAGMDLNSPSLLSDLAERLPEGWSPVEGQLLIPMSDAVNKTAMLSPLVQVYDALLAQEKYLPAVIETITRPHHPGVPLPTGEKKIAMMARHLGQAARHPLADSQRTSLEASALLEHGDILAVNGPPGTGKTALILSIVANEIVHAALAGGDPAVVMVSSTNNQAITNILDRLHRVLNASEDAQSDPLAQRWIPGLTGLGLYLPATAKGKGGDWHVYHYGRQQENGLMARLKQGVQTREAWEYFRSKCMYSLGLRPDTPAEAADMLQDTLRQEVSAVREAAGAILRRQEIEHLMLRLREQYGYAPGIEQEWLNRIGNLERDVDMCRSEESRIHRLLAWIPAVRRKIEGEREAVLRKHGLSCGWDAIETEIAKQKRIYQECRQAGERYQAVCAADPGYGLGASEGRSSDQDRLGELDGGTRFRAFCLALHYWEARWLAKMETLKTGGRGGGLHAWDYAPSAEAFREGWELRAMLFPCLVSTLHMAPRYLTYLRRESAASRTLFEFLSLLIVEEAGQVSPELAAPTLALAKKAVIVGDPEQIEPVWSVSEALDCENALNHHLIERMESYADLRRSAMTSHGTSLQERARQVSVFSGTGEEGITLTEHRRCDPRIIGFCNELVYKGRLEPIRPPNRYAEDDPVPVLGYLHVGGFSTGEYGSRSNLLEASAVAAWLARYGDHLRRRYDVHDLKDTVAIVTPFRAQESAIQEMLIHHGFRDRITIGTIHKLQGAERKVVLLSTVYGYGDSGFFYDETPNMLNVAVSRAEDSFLWFGNLDAAPAEPAPSAKLLAYLLRHGRSLRLDGYATPDVLERFGGKYGVEQTGIIEDPEIFRGAVIEALSQSAEKSVLLAVGHAEAEGQTAAPDLRSALDSALDRGIAIDVICARPGDWDGEAPGCKRLRARPTFATGMVVDGVYLFWGGRLTPGSAPAGETIAIAGGGAVELADRFARTLAE